MNIISERPRYLLRSNMQAVPSSDLEEEDLSDVNHGYRTYQENLIKRKPIGSGTKVQTYVAASEVWSEEKVAPVKTIWRMTWTRVGPLLGLTALLLTILSIPAAFAILRASDGQPVDSWTYSPSVYLAVMTSITGKATSLAALQGAVIAWWLRALRGSTFEQLHLDWQMGQNIWDAVIAGRRINMIAIACICGTIAAIDAPLLQRASSVVLTTPNTTVDLNVNLVPEMPGYYSGQVTYTNNTNRMGITIDFNQDFIPVMKDWISEKPIAGIVEGCQGTCSVTIQAPMVGIWNCSTSSRYVNYTGPVPEDLPYEDAYDNKTFQNNRTAFSTQFNMGARVQPNLTYGSMYEGREFASIIVGFSDQEATDTCAGNFNTKACLVASAIGEYDLIVRDNETQFAGGSAKPRFVAWANNTAITDETNIKYNLTSGNPYVQYNNSNYNSTFSGMVYALSLKLGPLGGAQVYFVPIDWPWHPNIGGIDQFSMKYVKDYINFTRGDACIPAWNDPFDDLLASFNELAFRVGVQTSRPALRDWLTAEEYTHLDPGIADKINYTASGLNTSPINIFKVNYLFFFGAALVQLICVGVIMYTFYGWWTLGRAVSFSPLEMAKAFEAPMLADVNSNGDADDMGKELGNKRVKYGIVGANSDRLAFSDGQVVQRPWQGATFR